MWKISGNGLKEDSYILLTTTNLCKSTPLNSKMVAALNSVKYICYEQSSRDPKNKSKLQALGMVNSEKQSAKNNMSSSVYSNLVDIASEAGLDENTVNMIKPVFLFKIIINNSIVDCNTSSTKVYENYVREYANKKAIKQGELFGLEEYTKLFDGYDKAFWDKSIGFLLNNRDKMQTDLEAKEIFYAQENVHGLTSLCITNGYLNARYGYPEIENAKMKLSSTRIDAIVKNQSTLFLIDFMSVANPKSSLFTFLNKLGYELTPVSNNNL
ncbi:MAG: TraB/GumN family protein [Arcicella sp.]|nr:TraB/GumN family protein [Arcicella sp.]